MLDNGPFALTRAELEAFLTERPRYAAVASLRKDGSPIVIPLGFLYEDGWIYISFAPGRSGVTRLRRDPRASVSVFSDGFPVTFAVIQGEMEEFPDPDLELSKRKHRWAMQLASDIDHAKFEEEHFRLGRVVFRMRVDMANVSSLDMRKMTEIETQGAMTQQERAALDG